MYQVKLQEELAKTWNYNLNINTMTGKGRASTANPDALPDEQTSLLFALADSNPEYGVDSIFQRMGAKHCDQYDANASLTKGCETGWRYTNQTLDNGCYLQDSSGNFLTLTGAALVPSTPPKGKVSLKLPNIWMIAATTLISMLAPQVLRPTTATGAKKNNCPDSIFSSEWRFYSTGGRFRKAGFEGTVSRINNDGEYNVIYEHAATTVDPTTNFTACKSLPSVSFSFRWYHCCFVQLHVLMNSIVLPISYASPMHAHRRQRSSAVG
eukprot:SAG31_NODE_3270_length_4477_cov_2.498401_5_plen_267_part_00